MPDGLIRKTRPFAFSAPCICDIFPFGTVFKAIDLEEGLNEIDCFISPDRKLIPQKRYAIAALKNLNAMRLLGDDGLTARNRPTMRQICREKRSPHTDTNSRKK